MKINSDYTEAYTTREDGYGYELDIVIEFDYQPFEDADRQYPGCLESADINEVYEIDSAGEKWDIRGELAAGQMAEWATEILEAIHKAGNEQ